MPSKRGKTWQGRVKVRGQTYTRDGFKTKQAAGDWEKDKRKEVLSGIEPGGLTLLSLSVEYLSDCQKFSSRTITEKTGVLNRALEEFGSDRLVDTITPLEWAKHFQARAQAVSSNAANKDRKNIHSMYEWGKVYMSLRDNPVSQTKNLAHDRKPQYVPPEADVYKVIMACTREEWIFLDTYLQTGARKSEILRLAWEDVMFEQNKIRLGTHKTSDGSLEYRLLDMSDELRDNLEWWWKNRPIKDTPYVFVNLDKRSDYYGQPYTARNRFMLGLCKRAKVKSFGFHAIRRYVASILALKGVPAKVIQGILGHHSVSTTERYIYNIMSDGREYMNMLSTGKDEKSKPQAAETVD